MRPTACDEDTTLCEINISVGAKTAAATEKAVYDKARGVQHCRDLFRSLSVASIVAVGLASAALVVAASFPPQRR